MMASASESQKVFQIFNEQAHKVIDAVDSKDVNGCRQLILALQALINSHASQLPARDLQGYRERIELFRQKLDDIKGPKKRFGFSRAPARMVPSDSPNKICTSLGSSHQIAPTVSMEQQLNGQSMVSPLIENSPSSTKEQAHCTFPGIATVDMNDINSAVTTSEGNIYVNRTTKPLSNLYLLEGQRGGAYEFSDVVGDVGLRNLYDCTVRVQGHLSALYINDIVDCNIVCGPVANSVLVVGFRSSSLHVACQQLRIHQANSATFRVHVISRPVIEDSTNIEFGPLPTDYKASEESWLQSGLNRTRNNFALVDDFNWLNLNTPSPNWKIVE